MNINMNIILFFDQFISRYCLGLLLILGIISINLNTIIFTKRIFRTQSCILYFLASTIANYPIIYFVIPCRLLADGFHIDPTKTNLSFCKFREFILTISRSLSSWFIVLASFDRLMSSSKNISYRKFCHIHIARWMIIFITIFSFIFYIHIPILFTNNIRIDQCDAKIGIYRIINDCLYSISYIIIPAFLMLIFSLLTIYNRKKRSIIPIFQSLYIIKRDRNLFLMFIFQFILFICTTIPHAIQKFYITLTIDQTNNNNNTENLLNQFFIHTARMISFINHSCQFYIFTLSSKLFREELKQSLRQLIGKLNTTNINRQNNQIDFPLRRKIQ